MTSNTHDLSSHTMQCMSFTCACHLCRIMHHRHIIAGSRSSPPHHFVPAHCTFCPGSCPGLQARSVPIEDAFCAGSTPTCAGCGTVLVVMVPPRLGPFAPYILIHFLLQVSNLVQQGENVAVFVYMFTCSGVRVGTKKSQMARLTHPCVRWSVAPSEKVLSRLPNSNERQIWGWGVFLSRLRRQEGEERGTETLTEVLLDAVW
jgi:hypothetical protein